MTFTKEQIQELLELKAKLAVKEIEKKLAEAKTDGK